MRFYTLRYRTREGAAVTLYNLQLGGAEHIEHVQDDLGSTDFQRSPQPYILSQQEIDLDKKAARGLQDSVERMLLGASRCSASGCDQRCTGWLFDFDHNPNPSGHYCYQHGRKIVVEFAEKVGERWYFVESTGFVLDPEQLRDVTWPQPVEREYPPGHEPGTACSDACGHCGRCC